MKFLINRNEFEAILPPLINDMVSYLSDIGVPTKIVEHVRNCFTTNIPNGKLFRGLAVPETGQVLLNRPLSEEEFQQMGILGWLVEMLQAYLLILDDIMDGSSTRRGQPCWYLRPEVGMTAINDACMLKSAVFSLLKQHFGHHPSYYSMVESLQEVALLTETGQECDGVISHEKNPEKWSIEDYQTTTLLKGGYYSFHLSVVLGLHYLGLATPLNISQAGSICVPLGQFYQVQNDYLDIFGDSNQTGKIGTDIQENKCSWVVIEALKMGDARQRQIILENYGQLEVEAASKVQKVFESLPLKSLFESDQEKVFKNVFDKVNVLDESQGLRKGIFEVFIEKLRR